MKQCNKSLVIYQLEWNITFWIRLFRGGSRTAATAKMGHFAIITKSSILDVAAILDPSQLLDKNRNKKKKHHFIEKCYFKKLNQQLLQIKIFSFSCAGFLSDSVATHFE